MADAPKKPDQEGNEGGLFTTLSSKVKSPGELNKELKVTEQIQSKVDELMKQLKRQAKNGKWSGVHNGSPCSPSTVRNKGSQ